MVHAGRHFLQIPGPTNVPDRVLRAMDMPTIDHRGPEFAQLGLDILEGCKAVFRTKNPVVIYPSSGTGAWEAAIVNTLSPGDRVLMFETGHFSRLWRQVAERFGIRVDYLPGTWRTGAVVADMLQISFQYKPNPALCQRTTVSGVTTMRDCCHPDQNRRTATQKSLSSRSNLGRGCRRFRTASC